MAKYLGTIGLIIVCLAVLIVGQSYWKERNEDTIMNSARAISTKEKTPNVIEKIPFEEIQDAKIKEIFIDAKDVKRPANILIAGSDALGNQENGVAKIVSTRLEESFKEDLVSITHMEYDETSIEFINKNLIIQLEDQNPDIFIFEPFTLNDNGGMVSTKDNHESIDAIISQLKEVNPDLYVILQPPHPLYGAVNYPKQVEALKEYAKENGYTYLDHWPSWPDGQDEKLKDYLTEDQNEPNEKGQEIWSKEILKLFGL